jgi:F0F1-type ATP synthase membrane subunit c/vacuolar-type H+-ATPase subunit K
MILMLGLAAFFFVTGIGIRKLKPWARIASGILAGLGLLAIPIGTLINAYILWLLFSKKGATVFSDDYKRIIAETPHVRQKTSIVVWVLIGLVVALVLFGLIGAVVG